MKIFKPAFEVAGVESSIRSLMECIEKGSTIVVVAVFGKDPSLDMFYLGEHELKVNGTMMYRHEDYLTAIDQVCSGSHPSRTAYFESFSVRTV